jgi:hypothetical protein
VIALIGLLLPLRLYSLPEPERIEVPVAPAFGPYRRFFPREAVKHPAKANLHLIERLIELASSPGDLILDPFAGTFSTCVVSVLMGREAVGVEIEQEYLGWGLRSPRGSRRSPEGPFMYFGPTPRRSAFSFAPPPSMR